MEDTEEERLKGREKCTKKKKKNLNRRERRLKVNQSILPSLRKQIIAVSTQDEQIGRGKTILMIHQTQKLKARGCTI